MSHAHDRWEGWIPGCACDRCEVARLEAIVPAVRELREEAELAARLLRGEGWRRGEDR